MLMLDILPIELIKQVEINKFVSSLDKAPAFELLEWEKFSDIIDFTPDLLVKFINDVFLIQFIDKTVPEDVIFMLSVLSLSFKKKYERKYKGYVIILFFTKGELRREQMNLIRLAEHSFDMKGEIDIRDLEEIEDGDIANYMEHKVWYEYMAYFKRAKEKGWL
ncbi:hypothetical protein SAMN06265339_1218 [Desulfurobacterium pacificum]|uniref:DUF5071 domain-containing protein n=1 Tax=Desulfurobacterium pacificum TaxID=240166 RepID=A0ABY1NNC3_9BACT|nr:hypothetical protein [Desulfurobacterium pacificum]SMP13983.1 hypothetical protein SAMN06265339_1218 [Desulfurobacterium pacificum]